MVAPDTDDRDLADLADMVGLSDPAHVPDGAALARIRDRLTQGANAGSGLWTRYCAAVGLSLRTANARIARAEGRSYDKRAQLAANCAGLPEPLSSDPETATPATPSAPDGAALSDAASLTPRKKKPHRRTQPQPAVDVWAEGEANKEVEVSLPLDEYRVCRKLKRYALSHPLEFEDDEDEGGGGGDPCLYAAEQLSQEDVWALRQQARRSALGQPPYTSSLTPDERARLPTPEPGQALAIAEAYEMLRPGVAAAIERKVLSDHLSRQQADELVDLFCDPSVSAHVRRLALLPADRLRTARPLLELLAHLAAGATVTDQVVECWLDVTSPDEWQAAEGLLAEVAACRARLRQGVRGRRRAAAQAEAKADAEQTPVDEAAATVEDATLTARERFAAAVRREREQGAPGYLPSAFSLDARSWKR